MYGFADRQSSFIRERLKYKMPEGGVFFGTPGGFAPPGFCPREFIKHMTKTEIISAAENIFKQFSETCAGMNEQVFFAKPGNKWSPAENLQHLVISTNTTTLAYSLPAFLVRLVGGTPNRPGRTYEEVKAKYEQKLSEGGKASGRFVPRPIEVNVGKQKLLDNWGKACAKFIKAFARNRSEKDLDNYLARHPLLGRITLRELGYFTVFHTEHHLRSIQNIANNA